MKKAGELLSVIIDEDILHQAQGYSKLVYSWARITQKHGISAAADHSRIRDLERNILLVEADHPGWIQILQTKGHKLLEDLQCQFPDLAITGISFRLSREPLAPGQDAPEAEDSENSIPDISAVPPPEDLPEDVVEGKSGYDGITDEKLRKSLKSLEKNIAAKNRGRT
ncbi:MAG: DUF721 domain-containing protein [Treponema sp.]|jgi:hypothetical protein|nr:DUF721 domain-containing protein [Treponema sp.]